MIHTDVSRRDSRSTPRHIPLSPMRVILSNGVNRVNHRSEDLGDVGSAQPTNARPGRSERGQRRVIASSFSSNVTAG